MRGNLNQGIGIYERGIQKILAININYFFAY
jgi:hypothetical protein